MANLENYQAVTPALLISHFLVSDERRDDQTLRSIIGMESVLHPETQWFQDAYKSFPRQDRDPQVQDPETMMDDRNVSGPPLTSADSLVPNIDLAQCFFPEHRVPRHPVLHIKWPGQTEDECDWSYSYLPLELRTPTGDELVYRGDKEVYQRLMISACLGNGRALYHLVKFFDIHGLDTEQLGHIQNELFGKCKDIDAAVFPLYWKGLLALTENVSTAIEFFKESESGDSTDFKTESQYMRACLTANSADLKRMMEDGHKQAALKYARTLIPLNRDKAVEIALSVANAGDPTAYDFAAIAEADLEKSITYWHRGVEGGSVISLAHLVRRCINMRQFALGLQSIQTVSNNVSSAIKHFMECEIYLAQEDHESARMAAMRAGYYMIYILSNDTDLYQERIDAFAKFAHSVSQVVIGSWNRSNKLASS